MDFFTLTIAGVFISLIFTLFFIRICAFGTTTNSPNEQRNRNNMHTYDTNVIPINQGPSSTDSNIIYPEHVDPVPQYLPPDETSHVAISIPSSEPSSATVQMPTPSLEPIDRPPTYKL